MEGIGPSCSGSPGVELRKANDVRAGWEPRLVPELARRVGYIATSLAGGDPIELMTLWSSR